MHGELGFVAASGEPHARGLEGREAAEGGQEIRAQPDGLVAPAHGARTTVRAPAGLRLHRELAVALIDALAKALAADRGGRPDDRRSWRHLMAIILPLGTRTRLFMT